MYIFIDKPIEKSKDNSEDEKITDNSVGKGGGFDEF